MGNIDYGPLIRDMVWSYSRIKAFDDCPYRWFLKYIALPRAKGDEMFFSGYGSFVHDLLAKVLSGEIERGEAVTRYLSEFRDKVSGQPPSEKVWKGYFHDGLQYLRHGNMDLGKVVGVEKRAEFDVDGVRFLGFLDLLTEDEDGGLTIVDHKSKTLKKRSGRRVPTKTDQELDSYQKQLYIYSIYVRSVYGKFPKAVCLNSFRTDTQICEPFQASKLDSARCWVVDKVDEIAKEQSFRPNVEYFKCRYLCEMHGWCDYYQIDRGRSD